MLVYQRVLLDCCFHEGIPHTGDFVQCCRIAEQPPEETRDLFFTGSENRRLWEVKIHLYRLN